MSQVITPRKTELGWIMEIPQDLAAALQVEPGSIALLYPEEGSLKTEILPPPSPELEKEFERLFNKYQDAMEELKRLGD